MTVCPALIAEILGFAIVTWFVSNKLVPTDAGPVLPAAARVPQLAFGMLLGGLFLVVTVAAEDGRAARFTGSPSVRRRPFVPALSDAPRHHARSCAVRRRRLLRPPVLLLRLGSNFSLEFLNAALGDRRDNRLRSTGQARSRASFVSTYVDPYRCPIRHSRGPHGKGRCRNRAAPGDAAHRRH